MIDEDTTVESLAAMVSEALSAAGINAILSGGAVVSIYSDNEYVSYDLDFITSWRLEEIEPILAPLGFMRGKGRHFHHPRTRFLVEFPPAPVMVGEQLIHRFEQRQTQSGTIRLLTPTDAVKDRLSAFFHWSDRQALEQALAIAKRQVVDVDDVERWALNEPAPALDRFQIFLKQVKQGAI